MLEVHLNSINRWRAVVHLTQELLIQPLSKSMTVPPMCLTSGKRQSNRLQQTHTLCTMKTDGMRNPTRAVKGNDGDHKIGIGATDVEDEEGNPGEVEEVNPGGLTPKEITAEGQVTHHHIEGTTDRAPREAATIDYFHVFLDHSKICQLNKATNQRHIVVDLLNHNRMSMGSLNHNRRKCAPPPSNKQPSEAEPGASTSNPFDSIEPMDC